MEKIIDAPFFEPLEYRNTKVKYQIALSKIFNNEDALRVLESSEDVPVSLKDIYVPLRFASSELSSIFDSSEVEQIKGMAIDGILAARQHIIICGVAGSGKSTLTKYLASALSESITNTDIQSIGRKVVIPFTLRELDFSKIDSFDKLWSVWIESFSKKLNVELTKDFFDFYIQNGWAILIFDGFDELGDAKNRAVIKWINNWLKHTITSTEKTKTSVILTSRPTGLINGVDYSNFKTLHIQPFNIEQIERFANNFFAIRYRHDTALKEQKTKIFLERLNNFKGLAELKHRPIYLAMLGYISEVDGEIPQSRAVAYKKMIEAYVHQLDMQKDLDEKKGHCNLPQWSRTDRVELLEELAYKIHNLAQTGTKESTQLLIYLSKPQLREIFAQILKESSFVSISKTTKPEELEAYYLSRTGLLVEPKEGFVQFSHLSFQEFLVARRIYRKQPKRKLEEYLKTEIFDKLESVGWAEIAQLFFAIDTMEQGSGQSDILHFLIDETKDSHYNFLNDLIFITSNKLSMDEKERWLKTLIFMLINKSNIASLGELIKNLENESKGIGIELDAFLGDCITAILESQNPKLDEMITPIEDTNDDLAHRLKTINKNINKAESLANAFYVGFYFQNIKSGFLDENKLNQIEQTVTDKNKEIYFELDKYIPFNEGIKTAIANTVVSNVSPLIYIEYYGSDYIRFASGFTSIPISKEILKLSLTVQTQYAAFIQMNDLAYANEITQSTITMVNDMARARDMAMAAMVGVGAVVRVRVRAMAMVMAMVGIRDIAIAMAVARDIMAVARDIDMARDKGDMARDIDMARGNMGRARGDMAIARLAMYAALFVLLMSSKKLAIEANLNINISKKELIELHKSLKADPIAYFESKVGKLSDSDKEGIKELLEKGTIMKMLSRIAVDKESEEICEEQAIKKFYEEIKKFNAKYGKQNR